MRKPERIPEVLSEVERIWKTVPDCRFFQFVDLLVHIYASEMGLEKDLFYLEDDYFLEWLKSTDFTKKRILIDEKLVPFIGSRFFIFIKGGFLWKRNTL